MTAADRRAGSMSVRTVRSDDLRALVKVAGELDPSTTPPLWAVLEAHSAAGRRFLRLDLSGVTRLDPSAMTGFVRAHQHMLQRRGTLVLTGVRSLVARAFQTTGLDERLLVGGPRSDDDVTVLDGAH